MTDIERIERILNAKYGVRSGGYMDDRQRDLWDLERSLLREKLNSLKAEERYGEEYKLTTEAVRQQRIARGEVCVEMWIQP